MRGVRRYVISVALVGLVAIGLLAAIFVQGLKPRLGLDLRGGLSVILTAPEGTRPDILDKTISVLRNRVDAAGVAEPEISKEGSSNILIQLPGTEDPQRLLELIGRTAQLQFRQVKEEIPEGSPDYDKTAVSKDEDPKKEVVLAEPDQTKYRLEPVDLTGSAIKNATAIAPDASSFGGAWSVNVRFNREGSRKWQQFTGRLACLQGTARQIAIVLDGRVESSPQVGQEVACNEGIGGETQITGDFDDQEAKDLALVLTTGALPVELEQSEVRTVSATLGRDSLRAGVTAGALGLALVMLYVLIYYRALGLQTWVGLLSFSAIIYALVVLLGASIGWSLTLSGIAGLIVSIGIATDSYIVFFERVKEEVHEGRTLRSSMDRGFHNAWRTLRTANTVTILAAIVLYLLAVGPVRGFALALGMATALDLAIFAAFTWPLAALLARSHLFAEGRFIGMRRALEGTNAAKGSLARKIYRSEFNIDFIGRRKLWLTISGGIIGVSLLALVPAVRGLQFGIDFRGGTVLRASVDDDVSVPKVKDALAEAGQPGSVVQIVKDQTSGRRQVQVQTGAIPPEDRQKVTNALAGVTGGQASEIDIEAVGEKWGAQITTKALRGLGIFLLLVVIYMSWRLEPKMAASGIIALLHDLIATAGIFALVGFEVTPATVIALLTILGYSLYDTVVVFDKIRENTALSSNARKSYAEIANASTNQVLMRSISTSLTTLIPVGSLLFVGSALLGADTLKDLALALFVGIAASTYSSIFVATPVLSIWKEREPRYAAVRSRALRDVGAGPRNLPAVPDQAFVDGEGARAKQPEIEEVPEPARTERGRPSPISTQTRPAARVQQRKTSRAKRKKGPS